MLTEQSNTTLAEIAEIIRTHDTFAICGHVNPDGDCLGSQLALQNVLESFGKNVTGLLASTEPIEHNLRFLPGIDRLVPASEAPELLDNPVEVFIAVDVPSTQRLELAAPLHGAARLTVTIDHHRFDKIMSDYNLVDPDSASTAQIVWELIKLLNARNATNALCALTGLMTDTGSFAYQNTNAECFLAAAEMVEAGARPSTVTREFFQSRSLASLRLQQLVFDRMVFLDEGCFVFSFLTNEDFVRTKALRGDAEVLISELRNIEGVDVALILKENRDGQVRGSLRAKDDTDVSVAARHYDGGGHHAAAGFTYHGDLKQALFEVPFRVIKLCLNSDEHSFTPQIHEMIVEKYQEARLSS